jgi:hypothetical protein
MRISGKRALVAVWVVAAVLSVTPVVLAGQPAGNNGTIKIDGVEFDQHPDNEPHVGCNFQVDFYGFDANQPVHLTFMTQPPTGTRLLLEDDQVLDNDDNSGGGSIAGLDGEFEYTLAFDSSDKLQPNQGFHVKLTIDAPGANGADSKYKVFWVTGCEVQPT